MKIDRRSFLGLSLGAGAGITLSPLPWKLTDDLSIWTQMWPWTPVPPDGEAQYVSSTCTLCPGGCGISVRKIDNRAVKIEGTQKHPVNDGGICMLGLAGLQLLYGPTRVKSPMKRVGKRGAGQWKEISWDDAIAEVVSKLKDLKDKEQGHTIAAISGFEHGTVPQLLKRLLTALGSPNFMWMPSMQDAYTMTLKLMQGVDASAGFDVEHADFVLSFGSGILEGWGSPVRMFKANSVWKDKKVPLIQFEPRLSNTAAKSDKWIPINPGTEAALALGIAGVLIKESLYDKAFVESHASGFDEFKQIVLDKFTPEIVSKIAGVDVPVILEIARKFAEASKPIAICGRGRGNTPGSFHEVMSVHALNVLKGNLNKEGGVWTVPLPDYIQWPQPQMDSTAEKGIKTPRIDGAGTDKYPFAKSLVHRLPAVLETQKDAIQALLIFEANPCYSLPDAKSVKKAFDKIPFVVSFSSYMDETAMQADLILPNHTGLERYQDVPAPAGFHKPFIGLSKPVVKPLFHTRHTGDVILQMAKALNGTVAESFPWESYQLCLEQTLADFWKKISDQGYVKMDNFDGMGVHKIEFISAACKYEIKEAAKESSDAVPYFRQAKLEGDDRSFPLLLIPYDSMRLTGGYVGTPPFLMKTVEDTILKKNDVFVEINPKSAGGLKNGGDAMLTTPKGSMKVKVCFSEGILPGLVAMPRGLGHTAYDKYLAGKGGNVNELIGAAEDPVSGMDAAWGIRASLVKA